MERNADSHAGSELMEAVPRRRPVDLPGEYITDDDAPMLKRAGLLAMHKLRLLPLFQSMTRNTATVFMIHRFTDLDQSDSGRLAGETLDRFLTYLRKHRYTVISLEEWVEALQQKRPTRKTVVLTIDDGYHDIYTVAYPILRAHDVPATVFIATDFIDGNIYYWWDRIENAILTTRHTSVDLEPLGLEHYAMRSPRQRRHAVSLANRSLKQVDNETRERLVNDLVASLDVPERDRPPSQYAPLTWSEVREMSEHGIDFHSHTSTHPIMTTLSYEDICAELIDSRQVLKERLGKDSDIFCYPNGEDGFFDEKSIRALKDTGFRAAVTGIPGFDMTTDEVDLYCLHRLSLPARMEVFEQYVCGFERFKERVLR